MVRSFMSVRRIGMTTEEKLRWNVTLYCYYYRRWYADRISRFHTCTSRSRFFLLNVCKRTWRFSRKKNGILEKLDLCMGWFCRAKEKVDALHTLIMIRVWLVGSPHHFFPFRLLTTDSYQKIYSYSVFISIESEATLKQTEKY